MAEIHRSVRRKALRSRMTARRDPDPWRRDPDPRTVCSSSDHDRANKTNHESFDVTWTWQLLMTSTTIISVSQDDWNNA